MGEISQKRERPEMPEGVEYMREQVSQAGGNRTMRTKRTELAAEREELDARKEFRKLQSRGLYFLWKKTSQTIFCEP